MGTRSALATASTLALAAALLTVPGSSRAGKSHMLQKPESFVVLSTIGASDEDPCNGNFANKALGEVRPDGTVSSERYEVPAGSVLVVTDVDWLVSEAPANYASGAVAMFLLTLGGGDTPVFQASTPIDASVEAAGLFAGSTSLTTGFRVGPGVAICPKAYAQNSFGGSSNTVMTLTLRGYLIKSK